MINPNLIESLTESQLLSLKICQLDLSLEGSWLAPLIKKLYRELDQKHLNFAPNIWVSDDWFSPDGTPGFAIPFYLLHPRLIELERKMMGVAEGDTCQEAMKLMRHETGHAIDNAFRLRRDRGRQMIFGSTAKAYPKSYLPNPKSREFVRHLEDHYAQAHPDEDWAETFSVWLTPMSRWQKVYANWPAIEKLECLDRMMKKIAATQAPNQRVSQVDPIRDLDLTLSQFYRKKTAKIKRAVAPLKKIFTARSGTPAWKIIQESQKDITQLVAKNSTLQHNRIKKVIVEVKRTCRKENLFHEQNSNSKVTLNQLSSLIIKEASGPRRINM
jgi:hypothetical protein